MTAHQRLNLKIDIFTAREQLASVIPALKPAELVAAIIEEFGNEQAYLGTDATTYVLTTVDGAPLDMHTALGAQVAPGTTLRLVPHTPPPPPGTTPLHELLYLREQSSGAVHVIAWTPALIGRAGTQEEPLLAVDLRAHPAGKQVSRRHAWIISSDDALIVEGIAPYNRSTLRTAAGASVTLAPGARHPLAPGDVLTIGETTIALRVLPGIS